jgi:hypothetical protein
VRLGGHVSKVRWFGRRCGVYVVSLCVVLHLLMCVLCRCFSKAGQIYVSGSVGLLCHYRFHCPYMSTAATDRPAPALLWPHCCAPALCVRKICGPAVSQLRSTVQLLWLCAQPLCASACPLYPCFDTAPFPLSPPAVCSPLSSMLSLSRK